MKNPVNRLEDAIRDYLADHLSLLEPDLRLVKTEYRLPNPEGAGGRIDILAKDRFGQFVIVELKRSDQSARQTLSELHKYAALFRIQQGLDERKVRLVVVSTEWHELLLPLAEFASHTKYSVEGIRIQADSNGAISSFLRIELSDALRHSSALNISPCQTIYFFRSASARDLFSADYREIVPKVGVEDFVLFHCNYEGNSRAVVYPFAVYFCFSSPLDSRDSKRVSEIKRAIYWDDKLDDPDENFPCAIEAIRECQTEDIEIGYPEKLSVMVREWSLNVAARQGRFDVQSSVLTDSEIIKQAMAVEGGSPYYLSKVTSPKFKSAWETFREDVARTVRGYPKWEGVLPLLLDELSAKNKDAVISASIYSPADLMMSLFAIARHEDYSYCPQLRIVVEHPDSQSLVEYMGFLVWDGVEISRPFRKILRSTYGDVFGWMTANHFGTTYELEAKALEKHNLDAVIVEWRFTSDKEVGPCEVTIDNGRLVRRAPEAWNYKSIGEFSTSNPRYLRELKQEIDAHTMWPDDHL